MSQFARACAAALLELGQEPTALAQCGQVFEQEEIRTFFANPTVPLAHKYTILEKAFAPDIAAFLKFLCARSVADAVLEICSAYRRLWQKRSGQVEAQLFYAHAPDDAQLQAIKDMIQKRHGAKEVALTLCKDTSLLGGCLVQAEGFLYDGSAKGALARLGERLKRR